MDKQLGHTPAMGWNSWNTFTWDINEQLIRDVADLFESEGYKEAGYEYIVIDDCWTKNATPAPSAIMIWICGCRHVRRQQ
ncbi:hypothetical protein [Paenibacillus sp. V4I7]|uniref:hypothetical protein n=1 Tax=Paenibacillus sp. V4I7 TaxID=3042307 RepID=UPI00277D3AA6|nr:hypothetical protein [Paenibacillus sp. V4I7]MDQ0899457.1 alpha-galactosidase [Paenibacillus sp. V4I7]